MLEFDLHNSEKLILNRADTRSTRCLLQGKGEDDVLNEITVESGRIAFTSDLGVVGVYDLDLKASITMQAKHSRVS